MNSYSPKPYEPDGGFSVVGLPILMGILLAASVGLGWLASFISQWFYLVLIFPLGIGFGLIAAGVFTGHFTKMRSPVIAIFLGLMSGIVAMVTMHFFDYLRVRGAAPQAADVSFMQFMNDQATVGVRISGRRNPGFNLGYVGTWIYWVLEMAGVTVLATLGLVAGSTAPFCAECDNWKDEKELGRLRGKPEKVKAILEDGEIAALMDFDPGPKGGDLVVSAAVCPNCKDKVPIDVKLETVFKNDKGEDEKSEVVQLTYPGEALADFETLFAVVEPIEEDRPRRKRIVEEIEEVEEVEPVEDRPRRKRSEEIQDRPRRKRADDIKELEEIEEKPRRKRSEDIEEKPRRRRPQE